jgi:hypothetical protein
VLGAWVPRLIWEVLDISAQGAKSAWEHGAWEQVLGDFQVLPELGMEAFRGSTDCWGVLGAGHWVLGTLGAGAQRDWPLLGRHWALSA